MAYLSRVLHSGDGTTTAFAFSVPYLSRTHVEVYVDSVITTAYAWTSSTEITFTDAPEDGVDNILIRRRTTTTIDNPYQDSGNPTASKLDRRGNLVLYLWEEFSDALSDRFTYDHNGWLGRDRALTNLADGTDDQDAATVAQLNDRLTEEGNVPTPAVDDEDGYALVAEADGGFDWKEFAYTSLTGFSAYVLELLALTTASGWRTKLGLVIGTDVAVPDATVSFVGDIRGFLFGEVPPGWLSLNGDTIGSAASTATQKSAAYETLYKLLWDEVSDTEAPVSGGRGADAASDWIANKTITLPDMRGRAAIGMGTGTSLTARTLGAKGGEEAHKNTAAESGMPAHSHGITPNGIYTVDDGTSSNVMRNNGGTTASSPATDADEAHNNMQPFLVMAYAIRYKST